MATFFVEIPADTTVAEAASAGWYIVGGFGNEPDDQQSVTNMLMPRRRANFNHARQLSVMTHIRRRIMNVNINTKLLPTYGTSCHGFFREFFHFPSVSLVTWDYLLD